MAVFRHSKSRGRISTVSAMAAIAMAATPMACGSSSPGAPTEPTSTADAAASTESGGDSAAAGDREGMAIEPSSDAAAALDASGGSPPDATAGSADASALCTSAVCKDAGSAAPDSAGPLADATASGSDGGRPDASSVAVDASSSAADAGLGPCRIGAQIQGDDFSNGLSQWVSELQTPAQSSVSIKSGTLDIDAAGGATVWFTPVLTGDIVIDYDVTVVVQNGANDHLTDLNSFWMASDPKTSNLFTRTGVFAQYDTLLLYYVGFGGNGNTTTRFRRYDATVNSRPDPLAEYLDAAHLLVENHEYHIRHGVCGGHISYMVDQNPYFQYDDASPYRSGRFAFRTVGSHESIRNFTVHALSSM